MRGAEDGAGQGGQGRSRIKVWGSELHLVGDSGQANQSPGDCVTLLALPPVILELQR